MDQNQLVAFTRIVREGSFSRAAWSLSLSQAAISARIQTLEATVGGPLFVRGGRRVTLTERGETFLPYASRALAVLAEGMEAARDAHTGAHGRVMAGAPTSVTDGFLAPVVARFRDTHPHVSLYLRTGHTPQLLAELADGLLQVSIVTWPYALTTADIVPIVRFHEPLIGVVAPTHPLAQSGPLTTEAFVRGGEPFYAEEWGTPEDARIGHLTRQTEPILEIGSEMVRLLVMRGMGATLLPQGMVADDLAAGRLVAVPLSDGVALLRELALVRHARADALPTATQDFIAAVQTAVIAPLTNMGSGPASPCF